MFEHIYRFIHAVVITALLLNGEPCVPEEQQGTSRHGVQETSVPTPSVFRVSAP